MKLDFPFAENETHLMSIGLDEDLDDAAKQAVREMVKHICARTNLSRNQAYMLCSLAGNLRVTQLVDGNKGVHMMLAKAHLIISTALSVDLWQPAHVMPTQVGIHVFVKPKPKDMDGGDANAVGVTIAA